MLEFNDSRMAETHCIRQHVVCMSELNKLHDEITLHIELLISSRTDLFTMEYGLRAMHNGPQFRCSRNPSSPSVMEY